MRQCRPTLQATPRSWGDASCNGLVDTADARPRRLFSLGGFGDQPVDGDDAVAATQRELRSGSGEPLTGLERGRIGVSVRVTRTAKRAGQLAGVGRLGRHAFSPGVETATAQQAFSAQKNKNFASLTAMVENPILVDSQKVAKPRPVYGVGFAVASLGLLYNLAADRKKLCRRRWLPPLVAARGELFRSCDQCDQCNQCFSILLIETNLHSRLAPALFLDFENTFLWVKRQFLTLF